MAIDFKILEEEMKFLSKGLFALVFVTLVVSACLFSPEETTQGNQSEYYSPVDSAYKVLANFKLAYLTKDIYRYVECLDEEFEFLLLETDWADYTGDGNIDQSWGFDLEEEFTGNMFASDSADIIELTLDGNSETIWYGDSTGSTLQLVRSFDLKVYYYLGGEQRGFRASGQAVFLCKPDESGEYKIWRWEDQSQL